MNFVENNGKKVAAILCVASAFPVVATVVAVAADPKARAGRNAII